MQPLGLAVHRAGTGRLTGEEEENRASLSRREEEREREVGNEGENRSPPIYRAP